MSEDPNLDLTLSALADPAKRAVIRALMKQPRRAGDLAHDLSLSPQSMSRHLRVLRRSGLVTESGIEEDARVKLYRIEARAFAPLRSWLEEIESYWGDQLGAFKAHAEKSGRRTRR